MNQSQRRKDLTVGEVMTPSPIGIEVGSTLEQAKQVMYRHSIRHLPVVDGGKLYGLLSDRDLKLLAATSGPGVNVGERKVEETCISEPYTATPDTPLREVLEVLIERRIGSVLIEVKGELKGIFTLTDAARVLLQTLQWV